MKLLKKALVLLMATLMGVVCLTATACKGDPKAFSVYQTKEAGEVTNEFSTYVIFSTGFSADLLFDSAWVKFKSFDKNESEVRIHVSAVNSLTGKPSTGYLGNWGYSTSTNFGRAYEANKDNAGKWLNIATNQPGSNGTGGNYSTAQYSYYIVAIKGVCEIEEIVFLCSEKDSTTYKVATVTVQDAGLVRTTDVTSTYLDEGTWLTKPTYKDSAPNLLDEQDSFDVKKVSYGEREGTDTESTQNKRYALYNN